MVIYCMFKDPTSLAPLRTFLRQLGFLVPGCRLRLCFYGVDAPADRL